MNDPKHIRVTEFTYDPGTRKFLYWPTGQLWKAAGVDVAVGAVVHEGIVIKATRWLKRAAR